MQRVNSRVALARLACAVIVGGTLTACSQGDESGGDRVQQMYNEREIASVRLAPEKSLGDLLPNHLFAVDGMEPRPLAAGIVIGSIGAVEPGAAYVANRDSAGGTEVSFDDPNALWRLMIVSVDVERSAGSIEGEAVRMILPIDGDVDPQSFSRDVEAMGTVIAVLDRPGAFEVDTSAHPVHWDGVFLAPVDADGSFAFAALGDAAEGFQAELDTVDEVMAAAAGPDVVVESTTG